VFGDKECLLDRISSDLLSLFQKKLHQVDTQAVVASCQNLLEEASLPFLLPVDITEPYSCGLEESLMRK
jgi:hypothetical protein